MHVSRGAGVAGYETAAWYIACRRVAEETLNQVKLDVAKLEAAFDGR
jgi:hypothetical protein